MKAAPRPRLSVEQLEDRALLTWGIPWYSPSTLTLSFVTDGTDVSGSPSSLNALLGPNTAAWEREILRAFQTWAIQANINIGLVADGGQPLGANGAAQGDPWFGDIRIAARPLSSAPGTQDLAAAVGFDYSGGTWSGDLVFNSLFPLGIGVTSTQYNLYSVALHEAAHSFGFGDDPSNPNSVLYPLYTPWTGLQAVDIATVQSLYGVRTQDAFEGASGNGTTATAFDLTANGNLTSVSADVTGVGDVDVYQFTTPDAESGITGLTVSLQAAGISLLTGRVTILDAQGNPIASAVTTDPLNNNLSVTLPNYSPSITYYVKVEGAGTDVFSAGAYNLRLSYSQGYGNSFGLGSTYVNTESGANDTLPGAQTLGYSSLTHAASFAAVGSLSSPTDVDWYRITPTALTSFTGTLTVGVVPQDQDAAGAHARVAVFDAQGNQLAAVVVTNENGAFTVQVTNQQPGATYYLRVSAANPNGSHAVGGYALAAHLGEAGVTRFDNLTTATLEATTATRYSVLTVDQGKLVQFSLAAAAAPGGLESAVRMTVFDSSGHSVFTMVAQAGQPLATGTVWLAAGTYTVVFNAATRNGGFLPAVAFSLGSRERSDPMDPYLMNPDGGSPPPPPPPPPPPGSGSSDSLTLGTPGTQPPPLPIIDPIANPFLGLE